MQGVLADIHSHTAPQSSQNSYHTTSASGNIMLFLISTNEVGSLGRDAVKREPGELGNLGYLDWKSEREKLCTDTILKSKDWLYVLCECHTAFGGFSIGF